MIVSVDFDGTLALGNHSHITLLEPNKELIKRLHDLKASINPTIKIVTARGSKNNLSYEDKVKRYHSLIKGWLNKNNVPFDEISFNKEYAQLYIDDMTINPFDNFTSKTSYFTNNKIIFTDTTVIKYSKSALFEFEWYKKNNIIPTPKVLFCNDETIITERVYEGDRFWRIEGVIEKMKAQEWWHNFEWQTYLDNIPMLDISLPKQSATMFHGDLSTTNVLHSDEGIKLIDSNYKGVFGNWMTDLGKYVFSLVAYDNNINEANILVRKYGKDVWKFAYAEGLRVAKYKKDFDNVLKEIKNIVSL